MTSSLSELIDRVNDELPLRLTVADGNDNPELINLLSRLQGHVSSTGVSTTLQRDLKEVEDSLKQAKTHWLDQHVLYVELQELLLEHQLSGVHSTPSSQSQYYKALQECLTSAEIGDYLEFSPDPGSDETLFGLKKEDIDRRNPHNKHLQSIQQKLIPEVESRLRKKCEGLVNFYEASSASDTQKGDASDKLTFAKASQLPALLEADKQSLLQNKAQLKKDRAAREKQFWQYYQTLTGSLSTLETLITRHILKSQSEGDVITTEWLTARCDAMFCKIKIMELRLQCDTYYSGTVRALTSVRRHLDKAVADTEQELSRVCEALRAYEAVGMGFDTLVEEFTRLQAELDNKTWALRELRQNKDE